MIPNAAEAFRYAFLLAAALESDRVIPNSFLGPDNSKCPKRKLLGAASYIFSRSPEVSETTFDAQARAPVKLFFLYVLRDKPNYGNKEVKR